MNNLLAAAQDFLYADNALAATPCAHSEYSGREIARADAKQAFRLAVAQAETTTPQPRTDGHFNLAAAAKHFQECVDNILALTRNPASTTADYALLADKLNDADDLLSFVLAEADAAPRRGTCADCDCAEDYHEGDAAVYCLLWTRGFMSTHDCAKWQKSKVNQEAPTVPNLAKAKEELS